MTPPVPQWRYYEERRRARHAAHYRRQACLIAGLTGAAVALVAMWIL